MTAVIDNGTQELVERYGDQWTRLNSIYYVMDEAGSEVLFRPNEAQLQLYREMWYLNLTLKARQLGFSTFIELFILDTCLFNSNLRAAIIADTAPNAEHLFEDKIRFAYERLPDPIKQQLPARNDKVGELKFANNSQIRVTTNARSGTYQILHVSEYGKIAFYDPRKAREIKSGSFESVHTGQMIFVESTARGHTGYFKDMVTKAMRRHRSVWRRPLSRLEFKFHFFAWWQHPEYYLTADEAQYVAISKDFHEYFDLLEQRYQMTLTRERRAWYVNKWENLEEDMYAEHPSTPEEAFKQPVEGAYWHKQMIRAEREGRITKVPYDPRLPVHTAWDLGKNDTNAIWFFQAHGLTYRFIDYYENTDEPLQFYAKVLMERGYIYGTMYLPHDASVADYSREDKKSRAEILDDIMGPNVEVVTVPRVEDVNVAIQAARDVLPASYFDEDNCAQGLKTLWSFRREWDEKREAYKAAPFHDWASHGASAYMQFARGFEESAPPGRIKRRTSRDWRTV